MLEFKTINQFQREENETQNNFQNYTETLQRQWLAYTNIRVSFELRFADRHIYIQSTGTFYNKNCKEKRRQRQTFEEVRTSMQVDHVIRYLFHVTGLEFIGLCIWKSLTIRLESIIKNSAFKKQIPKREALIQLP